MPLPEQLSKDIRRQLARVGMSRFKAVLAEINPDAMSAVELSEADRQRLLDALTALTVP